MIETGFTGLLRRAARRGFIAVERAARRAEREVLFWEARERLDSVQPLLDKNAELKDRHQGKRAFIIGNGPSLKNQDLRLLRDEVTFTVNAFWKHPIVEEWTPSYYLLTDGQLFEENQSVEQFFEEMLARVPGATYFFPIEFAHRVAQLGVRNPRFLALNGFLHRHGEDFDFDLTSVIPSSSTVVQSALLLAIWMGCDPICLIGCDHNWLDEFGHDPHFFEGKTAAHLRTADENPYRSDYLAATEYVTQMWRGYRYIKNYAERRGIQILNATDGGRLDVFARKEYHELFADSVPALAPQRAAP